MSSTTCRGINSSTIVLPNSRRAHAPSSHLYSSLGIDNTYFLGETAPVVADHILAIYSAKVLAYTKHDPSKLMIDLESITTEESSVKGGGKRKEGAVWIHSSMPGLSASDGPGAVVEKR